MLRFLFNASICFTLSYLIFNVLDSGEIAPRDIVYNVDSSPIIFYSWLVLLIALLLVFLAILISELVTKVDTRFKKFGGAYNRNTMKVVIKDLFNKNN